MKPTNVSVARIPDRRRCLLRAASVIILIVASGGAQPSAFVPSIHGLITVEALSSGFVPGFSRSAIEEISAANRVMDTGDCADNPRSEPARPCAFPVDYGEELKAKMRSAEGKPIEHFDDEEIQAGHLRLVALRRAIIDAIQRDDFVGARRTLGSALHSLQDFYSHSNWVELGNTNIESRLATSGFTRGFPPVAEKGTPTCRSASRTLFGLSGPDTLIAGVTEAGLFLAQQALLTTGYFPDDDPRVTSNRKCAHGAATGLNKDTPFAGNRHDMARRLATLHSAEYTASILRDDAIRNQRAKIDGFLGIDSDESEIDAIDSLDVGVPGAPAGASWDTAIGSALGFFVFGTQGLKNIQPDILVCLESSRVRDTCQGAEVPRITCMDADWSIDLSAYVCGPPLPNPLFVEPDVRILVMEVDFGEPRRQIARFRVEDPRKCDPFCTLQLDQDRSIWIRFHLRRLPKYVVPTRPAVRLWPAADIPVARPASGAAKPAPPRPGPTTSTASSTSSFAARTASAAPPPRTAEEIDVRLGLRDMDNCTGADAFYPASSPASLTGGSAAQLYQMAAFSMAISDTAAKQAVLNAIRTKVGDDAFYTAMTSVIADPVQSQTLVTAYQNTAKNVVQQVTSNGLTSLLPAPKPASALLPDVDRWILARLSSPALASSAVDLMSGARPLTAECTLNELAKQGFTATVIP